MLLLLPQQAARRRNAPGAAGGERLQQGQRLQPQAVAGIGGVAVGLVLHIGDVVFRHIIVDLPPADLQQGADDPAPHRRNAAQPPQAGAPQQVEQDGLRVVVPVVGGGDALRPQPVRGLLQKGVPQLPGGVLHPSPGGVGAHVPASGHKGHAVAGAPVPDELLVPVRRRPQPVVEVGGGQRHPCPRRQAEEDMEQGHGVPPAGDGAQHRPLRREHVPLPAVGPGPPRKLTRHRSASPQC